MQARAEANHGRGVNNENCPRFERCAVNCCPLHSLYPDLDTEDTDREKACTLGKAPRLRLGEGLRFEGLTVAEWNRRKSWLSKSPEERAKIGARLEKSLVSWAVQKSEPKTASKYQEAAK